MNFVNVIAKLVGKETGDVISGDSYVARLYDKDLFNKDDFLSETSPDMKGNIQFLFDMDKAGNDLMPDIYFILFKDGSKIFKSKIKWNINFLKKNKVTGEKNSRSVDLGTFEV